MTRKIKISTMVEAVVREVGPEQIVLFGSWAKGKPNFDSDVDLLVVEREPFNGQRSRRAELRRIRKALSPFRVAKDVLVYSKEEVARWRKSLNHIIAVAYRDGNTVYERS